MFSRFDTIPACDGRTDRRTDGQTDVQPISITCSIADARKNYTIFAINEFYVVLANLFDLILLVELYRAKVTLHNSITFQLVQLFVRDNYYRVLTPWLLQCPQVVMLRLSIFTHRCSTHICTTNITVVTSLRHSENPASTIQLYTTE